MACVNGEWRRRDLVDDGLALAAADQGQLEVWFHEIPTYAKYGCPHNCIRQWQFQQFEAARQP
jgi:hypothetical protein